MSTVTIALVDDHRVVARSLKAYLESFPDLKVTGIAASGEELLEHLEEWKPQIVLQDLLMPGGLDGIETTRRILERAPSVRVIALTASTDEARMMGVLRAGAAGYVRKDAEPEILLDAVRAVARGKTYIDPSLTRQIVRAAAPQDDLTPRELEVLRQVALGRVVMHQRERLLAIEPRDNGMVAWSLRSHDEVRDASEFFDDIPDRKPDAQMIAIAEKIIEQQEGPFDPSQFTDRYEDALRALIKEKRSGKGRKVAAPEPDDSNVVDLMQALRQSLGGKASSKAKAAKPKPGRRSG